MDNDLQEMREQLARIEQQIVELHAFAQQAIMVMEQFQSGGMGKMLMGLMGGKR